MAKRFSRYDDDTKGKFTSVVRDGKGNPVTSGNGKAVMSRSFRASATAATAPSKPKATQTTGTTKRASTGGPARYRSQSSSTGGPARYQAPAMQTGPRTRPNNAPAATATTKSTKRVPGRAIALAFRNAFTGKGPTDPAKIVRSSRKKSAR